MDCFSKSSVLAGRKIVVDPGHGGIDSGANCKDFLEKEINLTFAKKIKKELEKFGAEVILTREKDISLEKLNSLDASRHIKDLYTRILIIEKKQPDIFLSIHINANPHNAAMSGPIVFYNKQINHSKELAYTIQYYLNNAIDHYDFKKHFPQPENYFVLRNTSSPGVLIELGFMTNNKEKRLLKQDHYQFKLVTSIRKGLEEYFLMQPAKS